MKANKTPPNNLLKLLYQVEHLLAAEKKPFNEFLEEFKKLKKVYKEGILKEGITPTEK